MIKVKNNSKRLIDEIWTLKKENRLLLIILFKLRDFCKEKFNKDVVITMIGRTDAEQDELYKNDSKYLVKKFKSPHQFWHALDIRSFIFTKDEIKQIEDFLNNNYNAANYYNWTAKCHNIGAGDHFHIQFFKKG